MESGEAEKMGMDEAQTEAYCRYVLEWKISCDAAELEQETFLVQNIKPVSKAL
jgi:hypothetical protein